MKWNKTLTAEQIALLVTGLGDYKTIRDARDEHFSLFDDGDYSSMNEAESITQAIQEEIILVDPYANDYGCGIDERVLKSTCLIIAHRCATCEEGFLSVNNTTVTRESAAQWFLSVGDIEKARILSPSIKGDASPVQPKNTSNVIRTSDEALIEALGVMSMMLTESSGGLTYGNKVNASGIVTAIEKRAKESGYPIKGISNLAKDIAKSVRKIQIKETTSQSKPK